MAWYDHEYLKIFSVEADVVSVIGACITLWLALKVNDVRRRYVSKVRIPEIVEELRAQSLLISKLVGRMIDHVDIAPRASEIGALLKSAATKVDKKTSKEVERVSQRIAKLAHSDTNQIDINSFYGELSGAIMTLEQGEMGSDTIVLKNSSVLELPLRRGRAVVT